MGARHYGVAAGSARADNPLGSPEEGPGSNARPQLPLVSLDSQRQQRSRIRDDLDQDVDLFLPQPSTGTSQPLPA